MSDFATFSPRGEKFLGVEESSLDDAYKKSVSGTRIWKKKLKHLLD
jgi:hypothetical protein